MLGSPHTWKQMQPVVQHGLTVLLKPAASQAITLLGPTKGVQFHAISRYCIDWDRMVYMMVCGHLLALFITDYLFEWLQCYYQSYQNISCFKKPTFDLNSMVFVHFMMKHDEAFVSSTMIIVQDSYYVVLIINFTSNVPSNTTLFLGSNSHGFLPIACQMIQGQSQWCACDLAPW